MAEYTVNPDSLLSTTSQMELTYYQILTLRQNLRNLKVQFPIFDIEYGEIRHSLDEIEKELDEKLSVMKQMMTVLEIIHKWYILREVKISAIYQYFSLDEKQEDKEDGSENKILGIIHGLLDAAGILFEPADAINGAIYGIEGDKLNAAISIGSCIPLVGDLAKTGKYGKKGIKLAKELGEEGAERILRTNADEALETVERITREATETIKDKIEKDTVDEVGEMLGKGGLNTVDDIFTQGKKVFDDFDIDSAYVKPKHLSTTGGNGQKFIGANKSDAESILKDVLSNGTITSITDNGLTKVGNASYEIVIDAGKVVGTKGETLVKIVISCDGGMLSAYPIK
ncbi:hypothetical protein [Anaerosporobacter faecicola]|uniref:hypothetical protein n=1 Tax=Anaerosporobacter faecicola TaxID=2718714 RepID=UPI00143BF9BB|nr:hypothetical protein [Anaerosporobacter faecicola]